MDITERINRCAAEYQTKTGITPTRVYLGRTEMKLLMHWAYKNQYIGRDEVQLKEGDHRPEVSGMTIYEVNDDAPHMMASA